MAANPPRTDGWMCTQHREFHSLLVRVLRLVRRVDRRLQRLEVIDEERARQDDRRPAVKGNTIAWLALAACVALGVVDLVLR